MKSANLFFGFGIGIYYMVGINTDNLWAMLYYTIVASYILCLVFKDKMSGIDRLFASTVCVFFWLIYLIKAINTETEKFMWIRFSVGVLFIIISMLYLVYNFIQWLENRRNKLA